MPAMKRWTILAFLLSLASTAACGARPDLGVGAGAATTTSTTAAGGAGGTGGLASGQCRADTDCPPEDIDECVPPGASPGCGVCDNSPSTCATDADCASHGASFICEAMGCVCMGQTQCYEGCSSDTACPTGEICGPTHRCQPAPCSASSPCPPNFTCSASSCQRISCTSDAACQGTCVKGACYATPGTCEPLPV
jgi:hypothetical protein